MAPNDRVNYGDLLFTHILSHYLKDIATEIIYCSSTAKDLSHIGGDNTLSCSILYHANQDKDNYLIIAGGECLLASWPVILSYVDPVIDRMLMWSNRLHLGRILGQNLVNKLMTNICRQRFCFKTNYPFTIGKCELPNFKGIYYNSVGASWLPYNHKVLQNKKNKELLLDCDYLAVRDPKTAEGLRKMGVPYVLVPDSAILLSNVFSEKVLEERISKDVRIYDIERKYIYFQINFATWNKEKNEIINQLSQLLQNSGFALCLCPIGTALGHSDDRALKEIQSILGNNRSDYISEPSIWDIMWLIMHADVYIGTSLHGVITAMSYEVPFLSHSSEKVHQYINSWFHETIDQHYTKVDQIATKVLEILGTQIDVSRQKQLAEDSIFQIREKIVGDSPIILKQGHDTNGI